MSALSRFLTLYALMYAAFGVSSPFLPAFFASRGLTAVEIGMLFGAGTAIRLVAGPLVGRIADRTRALRIALAACAALAALAAAAMLPADGFARLFAISLLQAAALAPITTLADALALSAAAPRASAPGLEYGWVRGAGSAAFIAGTLVSGQVVSAWGLAAIVALHAGLLLGAAGSGLRVPEARRGLAGDEPASSGSAASLLRMPSFRLVILISALVLGSHAMHDAFAVIRWSSAGVTPATASVLWSEAVAAEVVVFFLVGPWLVDRLTAAGVLALAASAGVLRWVVMASTADTLALVLVQPLHGLTFAALHLACMRLIGAIVPARLAATGQAMYALGAGATNAVFALAAGRLYASVGARGFLVMAMLCAAAVPLTWGLRSIGSRRR
jgi:MFS transporter, PPP family, 3-phenylpropionic acid transporter